MLTMLFQQPATFGFGAGPLFTKRRVAQHFTDRHTGRFQAAEKLDPDEDRGIVVTAAGSIPVGVWKQPDPLVIADGVSCQSRALGQFTDFHLHLFLITTQVKLRV